MKTVGKILIIVLATVVISWAMIAAVNANGSSAPAGPGAQGGAEFRPQGAPMGDAPEGMRRERGRETEGGWLPGITRNVGLIVVLVAVVTIPKKIFRKSAAPAAIKTN